jgi:hypothetical protein
MLESNIANPVIAFFIQNLIEQRILSMPVVTKRNIRFFGFLDMVDVVNFITRNFANHQFTNFEEYAQLFKEVESWNQATVRDAMAYPNWKSSPYHPVPAGYSLFHAFEMMARYEQGHLFRAIQFSSLITCFLNCFQFWLPSCLRDDT